jgi:hypothetical protein
MKIIKENVFIDNFGSVNIKDGAVSGKVMLWSGTKFNKREITLDMSIDEPIVSVINNKLTNFLEIDEWKSKQDSLAKDWEKVIKYVSSEREKLIKKYEN